MSEVIHHWLSSMTQSGMASLVTKNIMLRSSNMNQVHTCWNIPFLQTRDYNQVLHTLDHNQINIILNIVWKLELCSDLKLTKDTHILSLNVVGELLNILREFFWEKWLWDIESVLYLSSPYKQMDGLMQERRKSSADALELCLSCISPAKWSNISHESCVLNRSSPVIPKRSFSCLPPLNDLARPRSARPRCHNIWVGVRHNGQSGWSTSEGVTSAIMGVFSRRQLPWNEKHGVLKSGQCITKFWNEKHWGLKSGQNAWLNPGTRIIEHWTCEVRTSHDSTSDTAKIFIIHAYQGFQSFDQ